ncbi:hypothetical protein J7T55_008290 [Diaporthe amygdali]|uniref:uncharacterized protein n=1 Tax=Phomopsis amygdali TaxID=1214568 RepID=UPI0022FE57EB|nr:uncharacterized protein J7T55_008290 [Diaporthe amygdali]KAJ0121128.1 hypothetical protein J7T55_008290 [Diaporthe amygdali]
MDNSTRDQPDRASPPLEIPTQEEQEAMKKAMMEMLESNPEYMNTILHLYRQPDLESKPKNLFFYGSLMDPDVIRVIAETSTEPDLHKASIHGFKLKMWGFYPTLVPGDIEDTVHGVYWQAENNRQLSLLQRYETHRYRPATCSIHVEKDGSIIEDGLTFVWASDPGSSELKDGEFLLERYQLYFKPDAFKRKA